MTVMSDHKQDYTEMHRVVDEAASVASGNRTCGVCGGEVYLKQGRHSGKWFYVHIGETKCSLERIGNKVFFDTKEQAQQTDIVFKAR